MKWQLSLAFVGACGSVSSKPDAAVGSDGSQPDDMVADATPPPCDVTKPFGAAVQVGGVNTNSQDIWGWLSEDQRTIYFASVASGGSDYNLYFATRSQPSGPFSGVAVLGMGVVSGTGVEHRPTMTADGLTLYLETQDTGGGDIHVASRASTAADFSTHSAVGVINDTTATDWNPWISHDGLTMLFGSNRSGGNNYEIYRTTRASASAPFGTPMLVNELTNSAPDYAPVLSRDGLELFFASYRAGNNNNDIWHARRTTTADGFGMLMQVTELSGTASDEYPNWISPDRCALMFTSNKTGGNGGYDIWIATRPQ